LKDNETSTMETVQGIQQTIILLQKVSSATLTCACVCVVI